MKLNDITIEVQVSFEDIVRQITHNREEQLFKLICAIEEDLCDLDFTIKLRDHFQGIIDREEKQ